MPPLSRRTRRQYALTPSWAGDDGYNDLLHRIRVPRGLDSLPDGELRPPPIITDAGGIPTLRRPPLHDIDRIAALGEGLPMPTESDIPLLSRPVELPPLPRPQPTVTTDMSGRPTPVVIGGDPEQQVLARRRALEAYQPQKESKKSLLLRTLLGQLRGGLVGEGGSLDTLLGRGGAFDRRGKDEAWKQQQLSGVYGQLDRTRADRRAGLQDRLLGAQVKKAEAPTVPPLRNVQLGSAVLDDGRTVQMERTETGWKMSTGPNGQPITTKPAPANKPKVKVNVPGVGPIEVTPEAALGYYGTLENRNSQQEQKADEANFTNAQVDANIKSTEQQLAKVGEALANTSETIVTATYSDGTSDKAPNPRYNDLKNEQQQLQRELRDWQAKRKAPPVLTRGTQPDTRKGSINLRQWKADHPDASEADAQQWVNRMKQKYPNAAIIN